MPKFRKKPIVIEATRWCKNGDHPDDGDGRFPEKTTSSDPRYTGEFAGERLEGQAVRYFRHPSVSGDKPCEHCGHTMHNHGWIDTKEGGYIVCPGDFIITGIHGERYPCKPDIFDLTYEAV